MNLVWSVRTLSRSPGVTLAAVLTLALAIGSTTALFTVIHGVLLEPLSYRDADRLALVIAEQDYEGAQQPVRTQWPARAVTSWPVLQTIERIGFFSTGAVSLRTPHASELMNVGYVSGTFFETLDGRLLLGRGLDAADSLEPHVVISERIWRRLFAGAADAVGRTITLTGQNYEIVGVTADTFQMPRPDIDAWISAQFVSTTNPSCCTFTAIARLARDASLAAAREEVQSVAAAMAHDMPRSLANTRVRLSPLHEEIAGEMRTPLLVLSLAVGLLLLLACANVMNLLLARNTARRGELAVRRALGATRAQLAALTLTESAVLATAGAIAGIGLAALAVRALQLWPPAQFPRLDAVEINGTVVTLACLTAVLAMMITGILPALGTSDLDAALQTRYRGSVGHRRTKVALRTATVLQLAFSVVLLIGAMLFGRSLAALMNTDLGVTPHNVVTASLNLAMGRSLTDRQQIDLVNRLVRRVEGLPQVVSVGVGAARPPDAGRVVVTLRRSAERSGRADYRAYGVPATPGYFHALGMRLERGRLFTAADDASAPPVVIVGAATAQRLFGDDDPIGRTILLPIIRDGRRSSEEMTVVGVTSNVKYSGIDQAADDVIYRPFAQQPWRAPFLFVRTDGNLETLASQLWREIAAVDSDITMADVRTLDSVLRAQTAQPRFRTWTLGAFALIAVVIASVGLYSVIAYSVSQRMGEIGVRLALGADGAHIRRMVLNEGLVLAAVGTSAGVAAAAAGVRVLTSLLYGITPTDAASFVLATGAVATASLIAAYIPAARASRASPLAVIRAE